MQIKLLLFIVLLGACKDSSTREMFDAGDQEVITSFAGNGTMSVLYGKDAAFTLVTWEQRDHPQWYGSHINGRLQTVETVKVNDDKTYTYKVVKGTAPENIPERINFIVHQQASVFP